tara:strand:+ start:11847 stop:12122 length:276 start_codon:yes stop_codon:yes gene_type:complete
MSKKEQKNQHSLFGDLDEFDWWKKEWKDMPEFKSKDLKPEHTVLVHFRNANDLKKFSEITEQPVYSTTKSIWFPKLTIARYMNKRYIDEEE